MRIFFAALAIGAIITTSAFAQQDTRLTGVQLSLKDALDLAYASHPDLAASQYEVQAVDAARMQAGARPNPTLAMELEDQRRETRTTTLMLSQPFELGGKRAARIEAAERARDIANAQLAARRNEIRASVTSAYFAVLIAQERVRLAEASLDVARTGTRVASQRVIAGKVSPVEETRAQVAEAGVKIELQQANGELASSRQFLRAAVGTVGVELRELNGQAEALPATPSFDELELRLNESPLLRQANLEIERLRALAALEDAKRIPDVTVSIGTKRSEDIGRTQAVIGVSIPLPIFDRNRGNLLEALRRQDKAQAEAASAALRVRADALAARQRLASARMEVDILQRDVLPGAQTAFEAANKGFSLGKFSFLETLDAQRTLLQSRAQYLRALAEGHLASAALARLLGEDASVSIIRKE